MEQTLGKRIAENRKRLGLTQDGLAEKLGITAQAVSKWENDQSCPDITMLPLLAEIFGISTDVLLGCQPQAEAACQGEVVDENKKHDVEFNMSSNDSQGNWTFHWDSGRRHAMTVAVFVLLVGAITLLSRLYNWDVGFWSILWPSALLVFGLSGIFPKFSMFRLGMTIFGGYSLVSNLNIWVLDIAGELIFPVLVLLFGISLLIDALRKPKKSRFQVTHNGRDARKFRSYCNQDQERFHCDLSFGERDYQVYLPVLNGGDANVSFGELTVDLTGCEAVAENCYIQANCSFGELQLKVPSRFRVEPRTGTAFAEVNVVGHPDSEAEGVIYMDANISFGEIEIRYI